MNKVLLHGPSRAAHTKLRFSKGLTLLELMIAMTMLMGILGISISLIFGVNKNQNLITVQTNLKNANEMALYQLGRELAQSIKVFDETGIGPAFRDNLNMAGAPPSMQNNKPTNTPAGGTGTVRLPTIRDQGVHSPSVTCTVDPDEYFWGPAVGNTLFFAELVDTASFPTLPLAKQRTINIYRFNYYYISEPAANDGTQPFIDFWKAAPARKAQRLIKWQSFRYADYDELNDYFTELALTAGERTTVASALGLKNVTRAWDRDHLNAGTYYQAFYTISGAGALTAQSAGYRLERQTFENVLRLSNDQINSYSVAYNSKSTPTSDAYYFPIKNKVPYFYDPNPATNCAGAIPAVGGLPTGNTFPRGMETIITGPSTGRAVLVRLTTVGKAHGKNLIEQTHMKTFFAKDL